MKLVFALSALLGTSLLVAADGHPVIPEPSSLLPLATGNSWTYQWTCPAETRALAEGQTAEHPKVVVTSVAPIDYGGRVLNAHHVSSPPVDHTEKYVVAENVDGKYRIEIKTTQDVPVSRVRDGRYDGTKDIFWSWQANANRDRMSLSEDLAYEWNDSLARILLRGGTVPVDEFPTSRTNFIDITLNDGIWGQSWLQVDNQSASITYLYRTADSVHVEVPADSYDCIETITRIMQSSRPDAAIDCEIHSFFAPHVGLVREYQVTDDGVVIYDMQLTGVRTG